MAVGVGDGGEGGRLAFEVDLPVDAVVFGQVGDKFGIDDILRDDRASVTALAVGHEAVEVDREDVAGFCAIDKERAGLRVAGAGDLLVVGVAAAGVDGTGNDAIAVGDVQDG